tara:strand:+ start:203 stop:343 length:141 start_codon:yes stop_codon:yes gene_type:complete
MKALLQKDTGLDRVILAIKTNVFLVAVGSIYPDIIVIPQRYHVVPL